MLATRRFVIYALVGAAIAAGIGAAALRAQTARTQIFELRTYTAAEGKLQTLSDRFRDRTLKIFERHKMTVVGFWIATDAPQSANTLVYLMVWPNREVADRTWQEFGDDPEWKTLVAETEKDGRLWTKLDRLWLKPTEFSAMK